MLEEGQSGSPKFECFPSNFTKTEDCRMFVVFVIQHSYIAGQKLPLIHMTVVSTVVDRFI